jgi:hypothetical protein
VDTVRSTTNSERCGRYNGFGIWYKIKPFSNIANLVVSTCSSGTFFDTVITTYQGDNCRPQVCDEQNDDNDDNGTYCSSVGFVVSPFVMYWIFVDGNGGASKGNFELTVDTNV